AADNLYAKLLSAGVEVLYDDRDESPGAKFAAMDLIGVPEQLIIGPRGLTAGSLELKDRRSGGRRDSSSRAAGAQISENAVQPETSFPRKRDPWDPKAYRSP